uniref:Uncharacterized protein n=1 Tax=Plectus sambesii TaxID=2011161 RepID=A0A914W8V6_9BILA
MEGVLLPITLVITLLSIPFLLCINETRNSGRSYQNLPSCYMLYYADDDTNTTASIGFNIPTSLAFIQVHTLNYTDNDDSIDYDISDDDDHDGINDENDSGVDNRTIAGYGVYIFTSLTFI